MNIWLISIFENTPIDDNLNTRYNGIADAAVGRGHNVTFWASTFKHNIKEQRYSKQTTSKTINDNLEIIFVESRSYDHNISLSRLLSHYKFANTLEKEFEKITDKPDAILLAYPPVRVAIKITAWGRQHGIPVIVDIIDPCPETLKTHLKYPGWALNIATYPIARNARCTMEKAAGIIALSKQYLNWGKSLSQSDKPTDYFYPAINLKKMRNQLDEIAKKVPVSDKKSFNIIYAGSLGYGYDLPSIIKAAEGIENKFGRSIQFTIAGDGPYRNLVMKYEKYHQNLKYIGRVPKDELMKEYYHSDMGMTQHTKQATQSVTYKLFDLLGSGLPILNSLDGEMKTIIEENKVGLYNDPGDVSKLIANIIYCYENKDEVNAMRKRGIQLTKRRGDSNIVYEKMLGFIEEIAGLRKC